MNRALKKALATGLVMLGIGWVASRAEADTQDTMTVYVTPSGVGYGVKITSVNDNGYDFLSVALGKTTGSTAAIKVQNSGSVSEYFVMSISSTTGGTTFWRPVSYYYTPQVDEYLMQGLFLTEGLPQPMDDTFGTAPTATVVQGTNQGLGQNTYGQASSQTAATVTKDLWLKLTMPTGLSLTDPSRQKFVLTITGQGT